MERVSPTGTDAYVADILIVAVIIYSLLMMTRQTRASAVLKGLVLLLVATFVSDLLGLTALNWLLMSVVNNGAVVLVILFQPELRRRRWSRSVAALCARTAAAPTARIVTG